MARPVQNNAPRTQEGGVTGKGWKPGKSGNPGGRPKGLAAAVREKAPADQLADYMLAIWTRDPEALKRHSIALEDVTLTERTKALEWLSDRGYGKAPMHSPVEGGDPLELSDTDRAIAAVMDELAAKREAAAAGAGESAALDGAGEAGAVTA
jgi:hypothetical protein